MRKSFVQKVNASLIFILSVGVWTSPNTFASGVETHAHLFMKEGMTWLFRGGFNDPLRSKSWKDRFCSQANPEALDQSGLDIVVASLYAHPLFTFSLRDSIREQVKLARDFVRTHPNWIIARSPLQASEALKNGKKILILSLEGASGVLETEEDLKEFIDEDGIRIVTLLHLTDDQFGGVAFLKGLGAIASPVALFKSLFKPVYGPEKIRLNPQGLTEEGRKISLQLIQRKVWIDLTHASDASQNDLFPLLKAAGQPHLYTHTVLRKYLKAERGISNDQINQVRDTHGFIGLMPSEEMLVGTPDLKDCAGGLGAFARQYQETAQIISDKSIAVGSDFNGGIPHLGPSCQTGTSLDQKGLWNIGQSSDLWKALEKVGVLKERPFTPRITKMTTEVFLETWSVFAK